ncbi:MAG: patatin-like phospholipase family protein [Actinomycetota bacterium]|nr:patatin-like phospholipase family protein [Actinomycetota bacterium]
MAADGLAWPIDFSAGYGAGVDRGIALGGGGLYFVAWQVGYLRAMSDAGVDLGLADRVVGTSAGSIVATAVTAGRIGWLHAQVTALARVPALLKALAPASSLRPSQVRALDAFSSAADARPETVQAIGRLALAAVTPDAARMRANLQVAVQSTSWPHPALRITCVDAFSGERCVIGEEAGIRPARAAAASSAVPGIFPPQPIGDRRCMDGGVCGTGVHLDLLAGAGRVLVLTLGTAESPAGMTERAGAVGRELAELEATGTRVLARSPNPVDRAVLMDPAAVPAALADGTDMAEADLGDLKAFWS